MHKLLGILALTLATISVAHGQDFTVTTQSTVRDGAPIYGQSAWFALPQNYHDQSGKYFQLYVTSTKNTTVHIDMPSGPKAVQITAYQVASISMPLGNEMKTSSVVETKAIHVWSKDAPIVAYVMSHNPYTSDGFYVIPDFGLGRDYVVAAYEALFEGFGTYVYDFPSEFTIAAPYDNTSLTIAPGADIRGPGPVTVVLHPRDTVFHLFLNRGESIQYQTVQAQNADSFDVTGTKIHSSNPVAICGASQCPNIPPDYPYCDHICDEVPPIRDWGKVYYTTNFFQTDQGHDASTFLVIGTKSNQIVRRFDGAVGLTNFCTLVAPFDHYWNSEVTKSSRFESDYPFLLVQYINSSTYPNGSNGNGDPAMVVIPSADNFKNALTFQTPSSLGAQSPYTNYVNVIVRNNSTTTYDGKNITAFTRQQVDTAYSVYRLSNIKPGAHNVISSDGIGAYIYGEGFDESYAWPAATNLTPINNDDSTPPQVLYNISQKCIHVTATDTGSGLVKALEIDSIYNMSFSGEVMPIEGDSARSNAADICLVNPDNDAMCELAAVDMAGNRTLFRVSYKGTVATLVPGFTLYTTLFDSVSIGDTETLTLLLVTDTSQFPITIQSIESNSPEFVFDSTGILPQILQPATWSAYKLSFVPSQFGMRTGTIRVATKEAGFQTIPVFGFGKLKLPAGVSCSADELSWWLAHGSGELRMLSPSPNPSHGSVVVTYALRDDSHVMLAVYSMLGEKVLQSDLGLRSSGLSQSTLDLSKLPAASYILRVAADGEVHSARVTLGY